MASPVPSPSYEVPGGAPDGQVVNLVDDAPTTVYEIAGIVGATYYRPRTLFPTSGCGDTARIQRQRWRHRTRGRHRTVSGLAKIRDQVPNDPGPELAASQVLS